MLVHSSRDFFIGHIMTEINHKTMVNTWQILQQPSNKFNSNALLAGFIQPLHSDNMSQRALLSYLLAVFSKKYPSQQDVSKKLMDLYGATYSVRVVLYGDQSIFLFSIRFVKERIIRQQLAGGNQLIKSVMDFLKDMVFGLDFDLLQADQKLLETEKKNLIQAIMDREDDKVIHAVDLSEKHLFCGEEFQKLILGDPDIIEKLTVSDLKRAYQEMLCCDNRFLLTHGEWPDGFVKKELLSWPKASRQSAFRFIKRPPLCQKNQTTYLTDSVEQSVVVIHEVLPQLDEKTMAIASVFNALFGAGPASFLFTNLREKKSLAYNVFSRLQFSEGILTILAECDEKKIEAVIQGTKELQTSISLGKFNDRQLNQAKQAVLTERSRIEDSVDNQALEVYLQSLCEFPLDSALLKQQVLQVDKKEIMTFARSVREHSVFVQKKGEMPGER